VYLFVSKARRRLAFLFCGSVLLLFANNCWAGSMTVYPLRVTFEANKTSEVITVRNSNSKPLLLQPSVAKWSQVDGQEVLEPTRDILLSPPVVEIPAGESQTIRIVLRREADATTQASYRLILQEVPRNTEGASSQVVMALRITIPIFISAKTPSPAQMRVTKLANNSILQFANNGKSHLQVKSFIVFDGSIQVAKTESMFYVLPGQSIKVKVDTKGRPLKGSEQVVLSTDSGEIALTLVSE
jgi:fimbrial chaperone protein